MRIFTPCLIMLGILVWPGMALAIGFNSGSWTTSFNYSGECSYKGLGDSPTDCNDINNDSIEWNNGSGDSPAGKRTEAVAAANNPNGDGGLGARFWDGDGENFQTPPIRVVFPNQEPEIWIRWYIRYEVGYRWSFATGNPLYDKWMYMRLSENVDNGVTQIIPGPETNNFFIGVQSAPGPVPRVYDFGWTDVFGPTSDGLFHMIELHLKMDTIAGNDGIGTMWIDGVRRIHETNINYSGGTAIGRAGIKWIDISSNQKHPANGSVSHLDYDDIEIWTVTPPNTDNFGDPWIGPLNGYSGPGLVQRSKPPAPVAVN